MFVWMTAQREAGKSILISDLAGKPEPASLKHQGAIPKKRRQAANVEPPKLEVIM